MNGKFITQTMASVPAFAGVGIYDVEVEDIRGETIKLDTYSGKVLLIVNVASRCGYTYQYKALESLYRRYKDRGLIVLGFPSNDFLRQEPGTNKEILEFCNSEYGVTFPLFTKLSVRGRKKHPLYSFLTAAKTNPKYGGRITWNFNKFLVGRDGSIVDRFATRVEPEDPKLLAAVEKALNENQ